MSLRRLWVLVSHLPADARCNLIMFGKATPWTPEQGRHEHLKYLLEQANWQRAGGKGAKPKEPKSPRPSQWVRIDLPDDL